MKTRFVLGGLMVLTMLAVFSRAADKEPEQNASFWMQKKLAYSEKILGGLASRDFDAIAKNARSMNTLGQLEKWVRGTTPDYRTQLRIFQDANEQLIRMADHENLDGASLAFVQLTLSCVNCHKIVRDIERP